MDLAKSVVKAARCFGLDLKRIRGDIDIAGSPQRCDHRFAVQDHQDRLYVLECLFDDRIDHKRRILSGLNLLGRDGFAEVPQYLAAADGRQMVDCDGRHWQMAPFIRGEALDRPGYVYDGWRGRVLADFLVRLHESDPAVPGFERDKPFSLKDYIQNLLDTLKTREPAVLAEIRAVVDFIGSRFLPGHDRLPIALCHGDYHPLNVIWSTRGIKAVIDWEFMGYKPDIYDMANLIGCIGIEDPQALTGDLVRTFIGTIRGAQILSDESWRALFGFVTALRFAWLAEWLRNQDREMIIMECVYMNLLTANADLLEGAWGV